jgi:hypothetical protein
MLSSDRLLMAENDSINIPFGQYLMMCVRNRYRIVIVVKSHQR